MNGEAVSFPPSSQLSFSLLIFLLVHSSQMLDEDSLEMIIGSWEHICIVYAKNRQSILVRWTGFLWPVVFLMGFFWQVVFLLAVWHRGGRRKGLE